MYRMLVRRKVLSLFAEANKGNWEAVIDALAPAFSYRFVGDTPLGGTRTTHAAMRLWWERLYRLFPGSRFVPQSVVVEGPPWATTVMTHIRIFGFAPTAPDGTTEPYENEFMQKMTLRWGKVADVITLEDTQRFANVLPALAAAGISDATQAPIVDAPVA
jgi:ketosteroid isomerase-like protein